LLKAYTSPTANCQRVTLMLALCGLPHELQRIDRAKGEQKQGDFLSLNPAAMVPVLVDTEGPDGRLVLAQSGAILFYLAEKSGRFLPASGAGRVVAMQWLMQVAADVNPASSAYFLAHRDFEANEATKTYFYNRFMRFIGDCDRALRSSPFLAGAELSIADIALLPVLDARRDILADAVALEGLKRWETMMRSMPGVASAISAA
jgi:GST-like protein